MSLQNFVHLRLHTEYSLLDSVVRVPELMQAVAAAGMPAVALTDECPSSAWTCGSAKPASARRPVA